MPNVTGSPSVLEPADGRGLSRLCLVIGPMNDDHMPKLRFLAKEIVKPILPADYVVRTPDEGGAGNVMDQIIGACDGAALVVADMTGNNPNVLYEVGVLDSLGRLCIPVKPKLDPMAFDRAAYRHWTIDWNDPDEARTIIRKAIQESLDPRRPGKPTGNPVTNYYGAPLVEVSPAFGIALGYCENFVKNAITNLSEPFGTSYRPVLFGDSPEEMVELPAGIRAKIKLDIVVPDRLNYADHKYIGQYLVGKGLLKHAAIRSDLSRDARSMTMYIWTDCSALVDIPTAMNVMRKSIKRRLGARGQVDDRSEEWRRLEAEEIARFEENVCLNIHDPEQYANMRTFTNIRFWQKTPLAAAQVL